MSERCGRYTTLVPGAAASSASTSRRPEILGMGSSPAPYTSVSTTRSAAARLSPSSRQAPGAVEAMGLEDGDQPRRPKRSAAAASVTWSSVG